MAFPWGGRWEGWGGTELPWKVVLWKVALWKVALWKEGWGGMEFQSKDVPWMDARWMETKGGSTDRTVD